MTPKQIKNFLESIDLLVKNEYTGPYAKYVTLTLTIIFAKATFDLCKRDFAAKRLEKENENE